MITRGDFAKLETSEYLLMPYEKYCADNLVKNFYEEKDFIEKLESRNLPAIIKLICSNGALAERFDNKKYEELKPFYGGEEKIKTAVPSDLSEMQNKMQNLKERVLPYAAPQIVEVLIEECKGRKNKLKKKKSKGKDNNISKSNPWDEIIEDLNKRSNERANEISRNRGYAYKAISEASDPVANLLENLTENNFDEEKCKEELEKFLNNGFENRELQIAKIMCNVEPEDREKIFPLLKDFITDKYRFIEGVICSTDFDKYRNEILLYILETIKKENDNLKKDLDKQEKSFKKYKVDILENTVKYVYPAVEDIEKLASDFCVKKNETVSRETVWIQLKKPLLSIREGLKVYYGIEPLENIEDWSEQKKIKFDPYRHDISNSSPQPEFIRLRSVGCKYYDKKGAEKIKKASCRNNKL